ncbi:MAG: HlyD family efflux transporter periplasmic adaptor subunit [Lachnospiraceae bacterium]|nr:HlyD family efflux transporter periplasmic adaptor subunit [Lachnospiraceae bacterium]
MGFGKKKETEEGVITGKRKIKKFYVIGLLLLLLLAILCSDLFFSRKEEETEDTKDEEGRMGQRGIEVRENTTMITATGSTSIGIVEETFTPDYIDADLVIEEIYVSSGDVVEENSRILKITEDSYEEALNALTTEAKTTELAYRAGKITYEQSVITARYDYEESLLEKQQAQEIYDETVAALEKAVEDAQEAYDKALESLTEYQEAIENDSYKEEYDPEGKEETYWEDRTLLENMVSENNLDWSSVTGSSAGSMGADQTALKKAQTLYKLLATEEKEYKQAQEDYENAVSEAKAQINLLTAQLPALEAAITEAKNEQTTGLISAKATYDTTLASADMAESTYETALEKAEEELDSLLTEMEDAAEHLAEFEELLGDGYLYTTGSGTILMIRIREGDTLSGDSMIFAYSNPEEITVSASVDQADIASLAIGDSAMVSIDGYGNYNGTITTINPETSSSSRTSVTYTVTITLEGDVSELTGNLTASVIFAGNMGGDSEQ